MYKFFASSLWVALALLPAIAAAECKANLPFHIINRFVDNANGTVYDNLTGLTWMRCPLGRIWDQTRSICEIPYEGNKRIDIQDTWNSVMVEAQNVNATGGFAGISNWRVPNLKELASISMLHCYPPIDTTFFPDAASTSGAKVFWTSTPSRKITQIDINENDATPPIYEYHTQAWAFSFVDTLNAGKAQEVATHIKHHVLLVSGNSAARGN